MYIPNSMTPDANRKMYAERRLQQQDARWFETQEEAEVDAVIMLMSSRAERSNRLEAYD